MTKVSIYDIKGKKTDKQLVLPKAIFEAKINMALMAQAVKVFLANQRMASPIAKTRSNVTGSNKKIWRQKGTGRARHSDRKAPIFVGGGKAHGPKGDKIRLSLPKKMRQASLRSALSQKLAGEMVFIVDGLDKIAPKTKQGAQLFKGLGLSGKKATIYITESKDNIVRAFNNLPKVKIALADQMNTYQALASGRIILTKEAITSLKKRL